MSGRPSARQWTLCLSAIGTILFTALLGWVAYLAVAAPEEIPGPLTTIASLLATSAVLAAFVARTLLRRKVRTWFNMPRLKPADSASWTIPGLVAFGIVLGPQAVTDWLTVSQFQNLYHFSTTLKFADAKTGEGIHSIGYHSAAFRNTRGSEGPRRRFYMSGGVFDLVPRITATTSFSPGQGAEVKLSGVATEPVYVTFESEGYVPRQVRFDRDTRDHLVVTLEREPKATGTISVQAK